MKCHYHPEVDSTNACSVCSRFLCEGCSHRVKGRVFCQDCLVRGAELAGMAHDTDITNFSPARAAFFGLVPGIGAVYNHQYTKAVAHIAVFSALVILADAASGIFSLAAFAFWVFTIVDAYRSAEAILRKRLAHPELANESDTEKIRLPLWGSVLVLLGLLFFLNNLGAVNLRDALWFIWPLIFVGLGVYMIASYMLRGERARSEPSPHKQQPPPAPAVNVATTPPPAPGEPGQAGEEK